MAKNSKKQVVAGGEKHVVYQKRNNIGKGKLGDIMVNHPTKDKGKWDTINLTKIGKAKTVSQGVSATKKWHKDNPDYMYKKSVKKYQAKNSQIDLYKNQEKIVANTDSLPIYQKQLGPALDRLRRAQSYGYPSPIREAEKKVSSIRDNIARWTNYNQFNRKKGGSVKTKKRK